MLAPVVLLALLGAAFGVTCPSGSAFKYCSSCNSSTVPAVCVECKDDTITELPNCYPSCNYSSSNPKFVPNCQKCSEFAPASCDVCSPGFYIADQGLRCAPAIDCPAGSTTPNCLKCSDFGMCAQCADPFYLVDFGTSCRIDCSKLATLPAEYSKGCVTCDEKGFCSKCDETYIWTSQHGGSCIPSICAHIDSKGQATVCNNHGTCDLTVIFGAACTCNGNNRVGEKKCACMDGYEEDSNGDCQPPKCPDLAVYSFCNGCFNQGGSLQCASCKPGYYNQRALCHQEAPEGCTTFEASGQSIWCTGCKAGYHAEYPFCAPDRQNDDPSKPRCVKVIAGVCDVCEYGYTDTSKNCETKCTSPFCQHCDPSDPSRCTQCYAGMPPNCLLISLGECEIGAWGYDGVCIPKECIGIDPKHYNGYYGLIPAYVTCSGFGDCSTSAETSQCDCKPGHDPTTRCFSCLPGFYKDASGMCVTRTGSCPDTCESCDEKSKCLSCMPGYSNVKNSCKDKCTDSNCGRCSPNNPAICITCVSGRGGGVNLVEPPCLIPCTENCEDRTDGLDMCVQWTNGTGSSCDGYSRCGGYYDGRYLECNGLGQCIDDVCSCTDPNALGSGYMCTGCKLGYMYDEYTRSCRVSTEATCPQPCYTFESCLKSGSSVACIPNSCNNAGTICSNAGKCERSGFCNCDDPGKDQYTYCALCKTGYVLDSKGKCVRDDCLSGPSKVPGCTECLFPGVANCGKCKGGALPTSDNVCLSSGGLSGGAIAGIVIAVIIILGVAAFLIYWFLLRKHVNRNAPVSMNSPMERVQNSF